METKQKVIKIAKLFGNGAHVFVPRDWAGEQIILIKQQKKNVEERILDVIKPYLENILGVYLYGSYARKEQTKDSDIDLLIITDKKIKIKGQDFEIICLEEKNIKKAIKLAPILIYSAFAEAKPIINSNLLNELRKKYKPKIKDFKDFIDETKRIIKINEEFMDPYSIVLRLRGIYIIKELLSGKIYSNKNFRDWILKNLKFIDFDSVYNTYKKIKRGINADAKEKDLEFLLQFLKSQVKKLEKKTHGKKKKEA